MVLIMRLLFLLILPNLVFAQVDSLVWKKSKMVDELKQLNLSRIENLNSNGVKEFWENSMNETVGKCVVSILGSNINRVLNSSDGYNIKDSISTPFFVYYQSDLSEKPEAGSWYENTYLILDTTTRKTLSKDWHTIVITGVLPFGFQIYFENEQFKSRMFIYSNEDELIYLIPIEENLLQLKSSSKENCTLLAKYNLPGGQNEIENVFGTSAHEISVEIEIEMANDSH
jgi:hypothetical protein